jgi:ectoine hydroxylase
VRAQNLSSIELAQRDVQQYLLQGYLLVDTLLNVSETKALAAEADRIFNTESAGRVFEDDQRTVRSVNGPHFLSPLYDRLVRLPRLLERAQTLLDGAVYLHQYKINAKRGLDGELWEWHSDYWFWKVEDGMPAPDALTAAIFLDDVTLFNGPMLMAPGTHRQEITADHHEQPEPGKGTGWENTTSKHLKHRLRRDYLQHVIGEAGLELATGRAGSVLFFHSNLLHSSSTNMSPWDRKMVFVSYSSVRNKLKEVGAPRPAFLASRNFDPLTPLAHDTLFPA